MMEKTLRVLGGEEGHSHSHGHGDPAQAADNNKDIVHASGITSSANGDGLRHRGPMSTEQQAEKSSSDGDDSEHAKSPSKLSAYLNLFGDFVHNM